MIIRKLAEDFFFFIDRHIQQKKIFTYLKKDINEFKQISIDVGAHTGLYTDQIIKLNSKIKVLLFEPQHDYFKNLKFKYKNNKRIKIFNIALSNSSKISKLFINKHDLTTSLNLFEKKKSFFFFFKSLLFNSSPEKMVSKEIKIRTRKLSTILTVKKSKKIDLIKIDAEGHDFNILKGLGEHIKKTNIIVIEFHKKDTFKNYDPYKMHKYLINKKFTLKKIYKFPLLNFEDRIYKKNV